MGYYNDLTLSYTNEDAEHYDRMDYGAAQSDRGAPILCVTCGDDGDCPDCDFTALARQYARLYQISFYVAQADITRRRQAHGDNEATRWFRRVFAGEKLAWSTIA
jgi:hypothetical protein